MTPPTPEVQGSDSRWQHGTITGYFNHACRCEACRSVGAKYMRDRRRRTRDYKPTGADRV